jgi:peptidyl-tRNA hydrolase, PTH1 family
MDHPADLPEKRFVIVGLGNPGREYALTRHNIGFLIIQAFAAEQQWNFKGEKRFQAGVSVGKFDQFTIDLLLPLTYMNLSGQAVKPYLDFYKLSPDRLIVVADDVALPFGQLRVRKSGSPGGHNGLKSIAAHLQTDHYLRLRVGIGLEQRDGGLADYVLDRFSSEEQKQLPKVIQEGVEALKQIIIKGATAAMNEINRKV